MVRIAEDQRFPFDVKLPNATTRKAIDELELEQGKGMRFESTDEMFKDLGIVGE